MAHLRAALGNGRQNDIVDQGKVNRNFTLDVKLIKEKKRNLSSTKQNTRFVGEFSNEAFSIYKGELLFTKRSHRPGNFLRSNPPVFSNWLGEESVTMDTKYDPDEEDLSSYEDGVEFVGIAQGSGSVFDDKVKHQVLDIAGTAGGTQTITNNGNERLKNGDLIMWRAPTTVENNKDYKGSGRWLAQIEVYKPEKHRLTVKSFLRYLTNPDDFDEHDSFAVAFRQESAALQGVLKDMTDANFLDNLKNSEKSSKEAKLLERLLVIVDRLNFRAKRRVFAMVLYPAEPGEKVDILLKNSYEIY